MSCGFYRNRKVKPIFDFHDQVHDFSRVKVSFLSQVCIPIQANCTGADRRKGCANHRLDRLTRANQVNTYNGQLGL